MSKEPLSTRPPSISLVPTRFVWPYGGQCVYLCGSFTRWQDMIPMAPIEGRPSAFQVICSLTPGYYQFKFVVDSKWSHDEQQPFITDSTGNHSNCLLVKESEGGCTTSQKVKVPLFGGSMEIEDRDMLVDRVSMVGFARPHEVPLEEGIENISVADIDASRRRIEMFLSSHSVYEILPESGKVVALDLSLPIKQAFHVLHEQGLPLAPLWDSERQQFVGMLTPSDFISILMQIGSQRAVLSEEELETHTIAAWKVEKTRIADNMQRRVPFQYVGPDDLLKEAARKLLQNQVTAVPVLHFPMEEREMPQILHLATLSGILNCLCRHFRHSLGALPLLNLPIGSLPLGTWRGDTSDCRLIVLTANTPLSTAFRLLDQGVSSIPIVDENGSLLDVYARSDITTLAKDSIYAHIQLDQLTVEQALQLVHNGRFSAGGARVLRCQMCLRTDSLQHIMERLAIPGVRRIVCVEAGSRRVEGIITLSDVFKFLLC